jgi:cyclopropane-fatty-acyl-phospholipid synthase
MIARSIVLALLRRIESGQLTVVERGRRYVFGHGSPQATVVVRSPRLWPALARGGRGLADGYIAGWWDSPDLTAVFEVAARNLAGIDEWRRRLAPLHEPYQRGRALWVRNTPARSRADISRHYDLGNQLFELMLDETMMYSSAIFSRRDMSLEAASRAKLERLCAKLDLRPSDHVLEIGTGWGGFALHAAATRGCRVTTTTISREQREYARARVREAGVEDRVTVLGEDYRELRGSYDKLVSIEMIEAVGWKDFGTFFARCGELLRPDGAMALQAITIDDRLYETEKASRTFIRTYIFPNGCLPSLEVIARSVARRSDLRMVDLEDITAHYAETLRRWRANFEAATGRLRDLGYDEAFQRMWRMYLSFCEAGFSERRIADVQIVLAKPRWRGRVAVADSPALPAVARGFAEAVRFGEPSRPARSGSSSRGQSEARP